MGIICLINAITNNLNNI
ncbi:hypothetical protein YPPY53_0418, partial [Yersinia pestis PY-53]